MNEQLNRVPEFYDHMRGEAIVGRVGVSDRMGNCSFGNLPPAASIIYIPSVMLSMIESDTTVVWN
jgi:hypothetical protein